MAATTLCLESLSRVRVEERSIEVYASRKVTLFRYRMKRWVRLLAITNCRGSSSNADSAELDQLRKVVTDPEKRVRSGSPKRRAMKEAPQANQSQSSSSTQAIQNAPSGEGTKNKKGNGKGAGKGDKSGAPYTLG